MRIRVGNSKSALVLRKYLTNNLAYGESGHRDEDKQMEDLLIGGRKGRLHFIR